MRRKLPALTLAGLVCAAVAGCSAPASTGSPHTGPGRPPVSYYLALGDSLSQGVQPDSAGASVMTGGGYANQLYSILNRSDRGLRLVKLGCPGETTTTMIHGGICSYPGGSQLAAAVAFLRAHRSRVSLITIDIGANDLDSCVTDSSVGKLAGCAAWAIPDLSANLTRILGTLRQASPGVQIVAMNYYLPELAVWRDGFVGEALARAAELAAVAYNALLSNIYQAFGIRVANVFDAFHTTDFSPQVDVPGIGVLPRNVATICQWTWECSAPPRGPNEHANQAGYAAIAHAFLLAGAR